MDAYRRTIRRTDCMVVDRSFDVDWSCWSSVCSSVWSGDGNVLLCGMEGYVYSGCIVLNVLS